MTNETGKPRSPQGQTTIMGNHQEQYPKSAIFSSQESDAIDQTNGRKAHQTHGNCKCILAKVCYGKSSTFRLSPWHWHSSWAKARLGCWATHHPGQWSRLPGACSVPRRSWTQSKVETSNQLKYNPPDGELQMPWNNP